MAEGGAGKPGEGSATAQVTVQVTVVVCVAPRETREWTLDLPQGASVADALRACGAVPLPTPAQGGAAADAGAPLVGVWGRAVALDAPLQPGGRVEVYRPLKVDPKVARRERFACQGARSTGLFARQRPGGKSGY